MFTRSSSIDYFVPFESQHSLKIGCHMPAYDPPNPQPSRFLLEAHAAVAEILHLSGMAEYIYIDDIMRDRDHIGCFSYHGSTDIQALIRACYSLSCCIGICFILIYPFLSSSFLPFPFSSFSFFVNFFCTSAQLPHSP
ncbi:hypothetical protein BDZ91DRAFT_168850 [Kalaharituber pfeilii]|nr:hypothetical protein BDZ91DRAFT_168850 [Kalaharituber pfeilii]